MPTTAENNKRIAKNTAFLYVRMLIMTVVGLFTSRIILDALGAADYGLNNVIGGVVILFSFLNGVMLSATERFLNFYLGKEDAGKVNTVFCLSLNIYIILSLLVVVLAETVGLWIVNTYLNIPADRMWAAQWVYQFTIIQLVAKMIRIPYNAAIIAYEKMSFYAYMSMFEAVAQLAVAYLLYVTAFDKLITFALLYTVVSILITIGYKLYANHRFPTTRYRRVWDKQLFREMFSFSGWSLLGTVPGLATQQGITILLNIFHGVTVNAAAAVANKVCGQVGTFISNFVVAYHPQIIKTYAANDTTRFNRLLFQTSKFTYFLYLLIVIPVMFTLDSLLAIWLVDVPLYTSEFCRLLLIYMAIDAINDPLWISVQAVGKIRNYQIMMAVLMCLNFPLAYVVLKLGLPPYSVWYVRIAVNIVKMIARCIYIKYAQGFPLLSYVRNVLLPVSIVTILALPVPFILNTMIEGFWTNIIAVVTVSLLSTATVAYLIGMDAKEKTFIIEVVASKLHKISIIAK